MAKSNNIPNVIRVKMLKDFKVSSRFTAKKGKYGHFDEAVARKMVKEGAAEEIVTINSYDDIATKKPYIVVEPEKNPTQLKQDEAEKPKTVEPSKKKTKEEKVFSKN